MSNYDEQFEKEKKNIFQRISNLENKIVTIQQKENTEDFCKGIAPYIISINNYFKASVTAFKPSSEAYNYMENVRSQINTIDNLVNEYISQDYLYRIPSIFNKDCPRTSLINSLNLLSNSIQQSFMTLISAQQEKNKPAPKPEGSLTISSPSIEPKRYINTPIYKEEYFKWNLTLPVYRVFYRFFKGVGNALLWFLHSFLLKVIIAGAIFGVTWHYWDNINEFFGGDEPSVVAPPYEVLDKLQYEIKNHKSTTSGHDNNLIQQLYAIINAKISSFPNTKIYVNEKNISLNGTYNQEQCRAFLDKYEQVYPEGELSINKVIVTERSPYSNYLSNKYSHPASFYCNEKNVIHLSLSYDKVKDFYTSNEHRKLWKEQIVAMDNFYHASSSGSQPFNHMIRHQAPLAWEKLKKIEGTPEYTEAINKLKNPSKFLGESLKK